MLQDWVKYKGLRVIVIFEGRDAAGKGGTITGPTVRAGRVLKPWLRDLWQATCCLSR